MTIDMKSIHDSDRTLVMGVLNITEDSSSDGGLWLDPANAKAHGEAMMKDGAESVGSVLFIVRFYGVIERLPVMG